METKTVKGFIGHRLATGLLPLLLLVLTQCVCSKGAMDASAGPPQPSKTQPSKTDAQKSKEGKTSIPAKDGNGALKAKKKPGLPLSKVLNLKDLNADELADLKSVLNDQFDPCGKPISFRESLATKGTCDRAIKMGNFVVDLITKGFSKKLSPN